MSKPRPKPKAGRQKPKTASTILRRKAVFLATLADGISVTGAAEAARIPRITAYNWRRAQPDFAEAWDAAIDQGTDRLEDEARRRAYIGTDAPVIYQGAITGTYKEYSDTLMCLLLKARRPHVYRERQSVEHSGPGGGPLEVVSRVERTIIDSTTGKVGG